MKGGKTVVQATEKEFIKVSEAAKRINVNISTMYSLCETEGFSLKMKRGKNFTHRINKAKFDQWIKQNSN